MISSSIQPGLYSLFPSYQALGRFTDRTEKGLSAIGKKAGAQPTARPCRHNFIYEKDARYTIYSRICTSSISSVFSAIEKDTGSCVVIKESIPSYQYIIKREKGILARLRACPSVVRCLNAEDSSADFLALELIDGCHLSRSLRLSLIEGLILAYLLVEAFEQVHKNNIIIRDVKDENIMIRRNGEIALIDFGLAIDLKDSDDTINFLPNIGTIEFMPPEICQPNPFLSKAIDYYSLGVVLYNLFSRTDLCGIRQHEHTNRFYSFTAHGEILTDQCLGQVPELLHPLLQALIQRDPEKRVTDPEKLKEMIFQAILQHLEKTQA